MMRNDGNEGSVRCPGNTKGYEHYGILSVAMWSICLDYNMYTGWPNDSSVHLYVGIGLLQLNIKNLKTHFYKIQWQWKYKDLPSEYFWNIFLCLSKSEVRESLTQFRKLAIIKKGFLKYKHISLSKRCTIRKST